MFFADNDDSNYEVDNDVGFTFDEIEKSEAQKSTAALLSLEQRLYSDIDPVIVSPVVQECDQYRRYESFGYDAHSDEVEDREILQWRRAFPYLQIVGTSIPVIASSSSTPLVSFANEPPSVCLDNYIDTFADDGNREESPQFQIVGKQIQPRQSEPCSARASSAVGTVYGDEEEDGECLAAEGVLEEIIAIHSDSSINDSTAQTDGPYTSTADKDSLCATPGATQRDEVVSSLFAAIWPDVVQALRPLVEKVVETVESHPELLRRLQQQREERQVVSMDKSGHQHARDGGGLAANNGDFCHTFSDDNSNGDLADTDSGW